MKEKIKTIGTGQTLGPYDTQLIRDNVRADFCVPGLAVQQKHIADTKAGTAKPEDIPRLDNCQR